MVRTRVKLCQLLPVEKLVLKSKMGVTRPLTVDEKIALFEKIGALRPERKSDVLRVARELHDPAVARRNSKLQPNVRLDLNLLSGETHCYLQTAVEEWIIEDLNGMLPGTGKCRRVYDKLCDEVDPNNRVTCVDKKTLKQKKNGKSQDWDADVIERLSDSSSESSGPPSPDLTEESDLEELETTPKKAAKGKKVRTKKGVKGIKSTPSLALSRKTKSDNLSLFAKKLRELKKERALQNAMLQQHLVTKTNSKPAIKSSCVSNGTLAGTSAPPGLAAATTTLTSAAGAPPQPKNDIVGTAIAATVLSTPTPVREPLTDASKNKTCAKEMVEPVRRTLHLVDLFGDSETTPKTQVKKDDAINFRFLQFRNMAKAKAELAKRQDELQKAEQEEAQKLALLEHPGKRTPEQNDHYELNVGTPDKEEEREQRRIKEREERRRYTACRAETDAMELTDDWLLNFEMNEVME